MTALIHPWPLRFFILTVILQISLFVTPVVAMPLSKHFEKLIHKVEGHLHQFTGGQAPQQKPKQNQYGYQNNGQTQYAPQQCQQPYQPQYALPPGPPSNNNTPTSPPPIPPRPSGLDARANAILGRISSSTSSTQKTTASDIFSLPISVAAPPSVFKQVDTHPVARLHISKSAPLETNKFHANFFLGDQKAPVYTQPYSLTWSGGKSTPISYGIGVSHTDADQRVFGETDSNTGASRYFYNPVGIYSLILSSNLLGNDTVLTTDSITAHSVMVRLRPSEAADPAVSFPVVQGMGFVTALYTESKPVVQSLVTFRSVTRIAKDPKTNVAKWKVVLNDGKTWWIYAYCTSGTQLDFQTVSNSQIEASNNFTGIVQVAKDPGDGVAEAVYDEAAGLYVSTASLSGSLSGTTGTYSFNFETHGYPSGNPLMYVLPHHTESWDSATSSAATALKLLTPVSGNATGVLANKWTFVEESLPTSLSFGPYVPNVGTKTTLSSSANSSILAVAEAEVTQDVAGQAVLESMYYSGKALAKFSQIAYVTQDLLKNTALTNTVLPKLKDAFERFINNTQPYPLYYESAWGGLVSSATYQTGDSGLDFGNTYYNDHHFHWGYFVLAAATIGHVDPSWLTESRKAWVNALVRDYANPSASDPYFPQWRMFDWYNGHSWAAGLFASNDGKNQESSSEDNMSVYALQMWGAVTGDTALRDRSIIQLRLLSRSLQNYYLYSDTNTVIPSSFLHNRAAGILFENKIDHTTYFGNNLEYVNGIHMIPLIPSTPLVRTPTFVKEEWEQLFDNGRALEVAGGWRGLLMANWATADSDEAWKVFTGNQFSSANLDGGASLTWYLAYTAAYGGL